MSEQTVTISGFGELGTDETDVVREPGLVMIHAAEPLASPRALVLSGKVHVIGRAPGGGGIPLNQPAVSRMHVTISRRGSQMVVRDMDSRNGTWVNGARIQEAELRPGDDLRIGDALFVFVDRKAPEHAAYRLDGTVAPGALPVTLPGVAGGLSMAILSAQVDACVRSRASTLILGETGVGKELVARGLHEASRREGAFTAVNCAALPAQLVESELFGYERGAFTGATRAHQGLVRSAERGTLFLDEIGDLPLEAQAKLLRVLATSEVLPVGATRPSAVDVRVVCATHRDLAVLVREEKFRADLYARVAAATIRVPPLRERKEDLFLLVQSFLARSRMGHLRPTFPFVAKLARHDWPFNVRELGNVLQHAAHLAKDEVLSIQHLPAGFGAHANVAPAAVGASAMVREGGRRPSPNADELTRRMVEHRGNVAAVARELERDPAQIYRWLKKFALDPDSFR
jgi:sigma-54 dependent transcriptional regulator, acetoin dehydrogenase operon transcriptional activator AcoR